MQVHVAFSEMFGDDGMVDRMTRHPALVGYAQLCSDSHAGVPFEVLKTKYTMRGKVFQMVNNRGLSTFLMLASPLIARG